jgi:hypothetical protein
MVKLLGTLQSLTGNPIAINNAIDLASAPILSAPNLGDQFVINGVISDPPDESLSIAGKGVITLTNANTYTIPTIINAGSTLALMGSGSIANSSAVLVDGTLNIQGVTPNSVVTITVLNGNGTIVSSKGITLSLSSTGNFSGVVIDAYLPGSTAGVKAAIGPYSAADGLLQLSLILSPYKSMDFSPQRNDVIAFGAINPLGQSQFKVGLVVVPAADGSIRLLVGPEDD